MEGGERVKYLKRIALLVVVGVFALTLTGCGNKVDNVEGSLEDIMAGVYGDISEDQLPMMLGNIEVTEENVEGYLGTKDIKFKEALASESMTGSIAHSIVLVRMENIEDVEDAKQKIKDSVDPRKWICVGVEEVTVESRGDLIIVILNDTIGDTLLENFKAY